MGKFAKPEKQASSVISALQRAGAISSFRTANNYQEALTRVCEYVKDQKLGSLRDLTPEQAIAYLEIRGDEIGQKALDQEKHAIQIMMQHLTGKLATTERLPRIESEFQQILTSRSYTREQVEMIASAQRETNALSTQIAHAAGLRGHELLTIRRADERAASPRNTRDERFAGRDGDRYTVKGKGGLVREVLIPKHLSQKLEALRLDMPQRVVDRKISYSQHYAINGGQRWANSFSQAAKRSLFWSAGAHGLRHSYAQERMHELQKSGLNRVLALELVSQEMGHFRPWITETYLR